MIGKLLASFVFVCSCVISLPAFAQVPGVSNPKPSELSVFDRNVGYWKSETTSAPSNSNGMTEQKLTGIGQSSWILSGWFLESIVITSNADNPKEKTKSLYLRTFDADERKYVLWGFQSDGKTMKWTGTRNLIDEIITSTPVGLPDTLKGTVAEWSPEPNVLNGELKIENSNEEPVVDLSWVMNRITERTPQLSTIATDWAKVESPTVKPPEEMKKLEPFIGYWNAKYVNYDPDSRKNGDVIPAVTSAKWILDGHFLLGTTKIAGHSQIWIAGYDSAAKHYTFVRLTDTGRVGESIGVWDEATNSFIWTLTNKDGGKHIATNRVVSENVIQCHMVGKDALGNVELDLTLRMSRRK